MAELLCLHLTTPQLGVMQEFYVEQFGMHPITSGSARQVLLAGPQRLLLLEAGEKAALANALFVVKNQRQWEKGKALLISLGAKAFETPLYEGQGFQLRDPEGNCLSFGQPSAMALKAWKHKGSAGALEGRLQHFGLGTGKPHSMQDFYLEKLGFALSDEVFADDGSLRSIFVRSNQEHHSVAVFGNGKPGFDHMSFEVSDWNAIKTWADHFARFENKIFWGPGRHGAGNNLFIFVYDPDQNMLEISSELQQIAPGARPGKWAFDYKAFNLWGQAAVRV